MFKCATKCMYVSVCVCMYVCDREGYIVCLHVYVYMCVYVCVKEDREREEEEGKAEVVII